MPYQLPTKLVGGLPVNITGPLMRSDPISMSEQPYARDEYEVRLSKRGHLAHVSRTALGILGRGSCSGHLHIPSTVGIGGCPGMSSYPSAGPHSTRSFPRRRSDRPIPPLETSERGTTWILLLPVLGPNPNFLTGSSSGVTVGEAM